MTYLTLPGADLYYETVGTGPLLLTISGANGSADIWRTFASHLASSFTVCMYDRRGFSRSYLSGSQDYAHRLETDADDAAALIRHLSPTEPATVLGNSSGAIVSLMLLTRHPGIINTLIPHEPPAYTFLPKDMFETIRPIPQEIYTTYRDHGPAPALETFADLGKLGEERHGLLAAFDARNGPFIAANVMYWFEREVLVYPIHEFDVEVLRSTKEKLVLVNGRDSDKQAPHYLANKYLGQKLGLEVEEWSGMHLGFASHPEVFAREFVECLKKRKSHL